MFDETEVVWSLFRKNKLNGLERRFVESAVFGWREPGLPKAAASYRQRPARFEAVVEVWVEAN